MTAPTLKQPSFKEIRNRGQDVDIQYLYTTHLDRVFGLASRDIYNDVGVFNSFVGSIEILISSLVRIADRRLELDLDLTNEFPVDSIEDKIDKQRDRLSIILHFMSRRGYWPGSDVEATPEVIINHILNRVRNKLDCLIAVEGDRGSGKSYTTLWLATQLDKEFSASRIFFSSETFREMLEKEEYPPGSVFMWDEAGAGRGLARRQAMTSDNIEFNQVLQVIRKRRYIVFFTVPSVENLDKASVSYFGGKIQPLWIDKDEDLCYVKFQERKKAGLGYDLWPYLRTSGNRRITTIPIKKPPKMLVDDYELMKDDFLTGIIKRKTKKKKAKEINVLKVAQELRQSSDLMNSRGNISISKLQKEYKKLHPRSKLGRGYAEQVKDILSEEDVKEEKE